MLRSLLKYHEDSYLKDKEHELFVFYTVKPIVKLAKIEIFNGAYWFSYPGMNIKCRTVEYALLSDFTGLRISHCENLLITGKLMGHTGVRDSPFAYVFWDRISTKFPHPPALCNINDLNFLSLK